MLAFSGTGEMRFDAEDPVINALRQMTTEQLLHLGERQVVYLKGGMCDGEMRFVLFRAGGGASGANRYCRDRDRDGGRARTRMHLDPLRLRCR